MASYTGNVGDDSIVGTSDIDSIDISQGGHDTVLAGDGQDFISVGGALDAGDRIDGGGAGNDGLFLNGDYSAGLVLSDQTVTGVENFYLSGDFDYDLTLADGTASNLESSSFVAFTTDGMSAGRHFRIDGSAILANHGLFVSVQQAIGQVIGSQGADFLAVLGSGTVTFTDSGGADTVEYFRTLTADDHLNGGGQQGDALDLFNGQTVSFTGKMMKGFDHLVLWQGSYDLTMADANLGTGRTLIVDAGNLQPGQTMILDGTAERSGSYWVSGGQDEDSVYAGAGADSLHGNGGDDILAGGKGADELTGGAGADTFLYNRLNESGHHKQFDLITDLEAGDHIDLSAIDANTTKDGNQAFHQVDSFHGKAGELVLSYDAGDNLTTLAVDVNGDAHADLRVHIAGDHADFTGLVL